MTLENKRNGTHKELEHYEKSSGSNFVFCGTGMMNKRCSFSCSAVTVLRKLWGGNGWMQVKLKSVQLRPKISAWNWFQFKSQPLPASFELHWWNWSHPQCLPLTRCPSGRRRSAGPLRRGWESTAKTSTASRARKWEPGDDWIFPETFGHFVWIILTLLSASQLPSSKLSWKRSVGELVQFYYLWKKTERHDVFANRYSYYNVHY